MRLFRKVNSVLGGVAIVVAVTYWFDLDNLLIRKSEPFLRKLAVLKKMTKAQQDSQNG